MVDTGGSAPRSDVSRAFASSRTRPGVERLPEHRHRWPRRPVAPMTAGARALITGIGGQDGSLLAPLLSSRVRGDRHRPA